MRITVLTLVLILSMCSFSFACISCEADDPNISAEAEAGDARAQYVMAWMYATGHNVDKSDRQSFAWLKKAADKGYEHAILRLGECYLKGRGVKQDTPRAIELLEKAACLFRGGEAASLLADIYGTRTYNSLNRVSAYKWLSISEAKDRIAKLKRLEGSMTAEEKAEARTLANIWMEKNRNNPPPKSYDSAP